MNRFDLRALTAQILNFNTTAANQDYTEAELNTALQQAYNEVVIEASANGLASHFKKTFEFTWEASEVTKTVPSSISGKTLLRMADVTESTQGPKILFSANGESTLVFWKDRNTMQWGTTGPSADTTIRATYLAIAEQLLSDSSSPELIPLQHHHVIAWAAAIWLKDLAEESVPGSWQVRHMKAQERLWKDLQRGNPASTPPAIKSWQPVNGDGEDEF